LYQAGYEPSAAALATEARKAGSVRISICQEVGTAVSMTDKMESGISARKASAAEEADAMAPLSKSVPNDSAVAVTSGAGVASAVAARRRVARVLHSMVRVWYEE
jgi:hypothetical protein